MSGLYIHIPFCDRKCFYCSFVVSIAQERRVDQYLLCLESESRNYEGMRIETIYVGGGTPTFLNEQQLERLFKSIRMVLDCSSLKEVTVESNPEGLSRSKLKVLKDCGVSRLSIGVQTLNEKYFKYLGRIHSVEQVYEVFDYARSEGFNNINLDFMFDFPGQTENELDSDVSKICNLESEHISIYSLTIEENSKFFVRGECLDDEDIQLRNYYLLKNEVLRYGFKQYELSNFSKVGRESLHNINYWKMGNYIGLGVGAHSYYEGKRLANIKNLFKYIACIDSGRSCIETKEEISNQIQFKEALLFGLRMNEGVHLNDLLSRYGVRLSSEESLRIKRMIEEGLLVFECGNLKVTDQGQVVLDEISVWFI